ncbi:MAG: tRNA epoxyqueuosine(34) reductase QueG [Candidatus Acidiferrales bacterium]
MRRDQRTRWVCERAHALGFDLCGVVTADRFEELDKLPVWLARGYGGEMNYLHDPRRADPRLVLEGAQSLIVAAVNYNSAHPYSAESLSRAGGESPRGWISRYAWGDDYHEVIKKQLDTLAAEMRAEFDESFETRTYVDTGPIVERVAAKYAGLGWLAKNTCLINQQLGSWLFLGVIITTLSLEPTLATGGMAPPDLCGSCTRCLDACPTKAFPEPYVLDARRCISYLTIELRGAIPEKLRPEMGGAIVGCDICQDVCPWNRKAPVTLTAAFQPRRIPVITGGEVLDPTQEGESLLAPELEWLASLSQQEFSEIFRKSAIKRAKWRGVVRNACIALGNSNMTRDSESYSRIVRLLKLLASTEDSLIAEHARWALARLRVTDERAAASQLL